MAHNVDLLTIIHDDVKLVKELLTGGGTPEKGIVIRVDRLETKQRRISRAGLWIMGILGTVVGSVLAAEAVAYFN